MEVGMRGLMRTLAMVALVLLVPVALYAQQATITGVVKDASGAVLPGVSVEAASPALTEKVRSVVDRRNRTVPHRLAPAGHLHGDSDLQGFNTVRREGIQLSGTLTATHRRRPPRRRTRRDRHRPRRVTHRRRAERPPSAGHRRRRPSADPDLAVVQQRAPARPRRRRRRRTGPAAAGDAAVHGPRRQRAKTAA